MIQFTQGRRWAAGVVVSLGLILGARFAAAQNAPAAPAEAQSQEIEELKKTQKQLIQLLQDQQRRLEVLEKRVQEPGTAAGPAGVPGAPDNTVKWNELVAGKSKLKFYGFLRLDAIRDDSRPNNTQTVAFIRSEDPAAPAAIGNADHRDDLTIHPRLTRLGVDFDGPTVASLGDAKVTGKVEIDFYNNGLAGQTESRQAIRMRHAWLKLAWSDFNLLCGQTTDIISPLWPAVNSDLVMWGAGNLGDRRPMIRGEYMPHLGPGHLILQGEIGLSGADDNGDVDAAGAFGNGFRDGETSGRPTLQARVAYKFPLWEGQNMEVGVWGHRAWEHPDTKFLNEDEFDSTAIGMDVSIPIYKDLVWAKGELWQGKNVDDVRGGIFQGINTVTGKEIEARGGWGEVGFRPVQWYSFTAGYSKDNPNDNDINVGGRTENEIYYIANKVSFDPVDIGLDYLHWTTKFKGFDDGDDNRFQAYIQYKF